MRPAGSRLASASRRRASGGGDLPMASTPLVNQSRTVSRATPSRAPTASCVQRLASGGGDLPSPSLELVNHDDTVCGATPSSDPTASCVHRLASGVGDLPLPSSALVNRRARSRPATGRSSSTRRTRCRHPAGAGRAASRDLAGRLADGDRVVVGVMVVVPSVMGWQGRPAGCARLRTVWAFPGNFSPTHTYGELSKKGSNCAQLCANAPHAPAQLPLGTKPNPLRTTLLRFGPCVGRSFSKPISSSARPKLVWVSASNPAR